MSTTSRRRRVKPTHDWKLLVPLFEWPEQQNYELIRPLVLFGESVSKRPIDWPLRADVVPPGGPLRGPGDEKSLRDRQRKAPAEEVAACYETLHRRPEG